MVALKKLGRKRSHRIAMLRTLVTQLVEHERIHTTIARAKELRKLADRMVTCGKEGTRSAKVRAGAVLRTERELHKVFTTLAERYWNRPGGYTRIVRTGLRQHDAAPMAYIEFVDRPGELRPARNVAPVALPSSAAALSAARAAAQGQRPYSLLPAAARLVLDPQQLQLQPILQHQPMWQHWRHRVPMFSDPSQRLH